MASREDDPLRSALFTDLYELTMAQAYDAERMGERAVFELFFRRLPPSRSFVMAAGLDDLLSWLETFRFTDDDLGYLVSQGQFSEGFLRRLSGLSFTGDVDAVPEGTLVFPDEPIVRVTAPILEAQLVETAVLNQIHFQSVIATKAARVILAARGRPVIDFGSRRAHGGEAALKVARACWLAGAAGTSNVLAGKRYEIPIFGTMAHSYIQAHEDELSAFEAFTRIFPETTLLVDTYDTLAGVAKVIALARREGERFQVRSIRLDSGDLADLARRSRRMLDEAGLTGVSIVGSSGLDEYEIARLLEAEAPFDAFGVGTRLAASEDAPTLDMAYKLVEYAGRPRSKFSSGKLVHPGCKQIFRRLEGGRMAGDVLGRPDERPDGEPLVEPVLRAGRRVGRGRASLEEARRHASAELERLPERMRGVGAAEPPYPVRISAALEEELRALRERFGG